MYSSKQTGNETISIPRHLPSHASPWSQSVSTSRHALKTLHASPVCFLSRTQHGRTQRDKQAARRDIHEPQHACHFHINYLIHGFIHAAATTCSSIYTQSQRKSNTNAALVCPMSCLDSKYFRVLQKYRNFENHVKN